jgi:dihydrofolate synthase / folylpolyglutamate synthase
MNYTETIEYLFTRLPMFSRVGSAALKPGLDNTIALCAALGNPHQQFKSVHVGGTNGKGSVSHMLAAILQTAGFKTGLYTSPHLYDFRERIRINGAMIPEAAVVDFVNRIQPQIDQLDPSFFEITVAMAFDFFANEKVDIAIIEVGLGGRLDSTNIITPELAVITNIGYDHMALLGNTLPEIAGEKAGIIKNEIPVVIGEHQDATDTVFREKSEAANAALFFAADHFTVQNCQMLPDRLVVQLEEQDLEQVLELVLDLPGLYQLNNVQTALMAVEVLQQEGWQITDEQVTTALRNVKGLTGLMGRWDVLRTDPLLVVEVAHNVDGMQQMLRHLQEQKFQQLHLVVGMVKDKDISSVLQLLPREAQYYFTQVNIPRALDAGALQEQASIIGLMGAVYPDVNTAIETALQTAKPGDLVLVCGSIFLAGEVDRERWKWGS